MKTAKIALVIGMIDDDIDPQKQASSLKEAELLLETYGAQTVQVMTQHMSHRKGKTFIGSGKADEVKNIVDQKQIDLVVVNHHLRSSQIFELRELICANNTCQIWDRTMLVLEIFSKHAHTAEAKLQIELARLQSHGAELSGVGEDMSQQGGGIGTRGLGETHSEMMRRHWRKEIKTIEEKLTKVSAIRQQQMKLRKTKNLPTVSIIGYTNAGKTSLFNAISKKGDKVQDALFATLDSSVSDVYLPKLGKKVFISDTIGFIQDLPTSLIKAFQSTLMETIHADILLHVVDASDPDLGIKIATVQQILEELEVGSTKQLFIFNKKDLLASDSQKSLTSMFKQLNPVFVSAKEELGLDSIIQLIESELLKMGIRPAKHLEYLSVN